MEYFLSKFKINFYWFSNTDTDTDNTDSEEIEKNNKT